MNDSDNKNKNNSDEKYKITPPILKILMGNNNFRLVISIDSPPKINSI